MVPPVWALAQDRAGFLWIGTQGGLYRYDGIEFRRWSADRIAGSVTQLASTPDGRIVAQMENGAVFRVTATGASPIPPPPGGWPVAPRSLAVDAHGRLWAIGADSSVVYRAPGGWHTIPRARFAGEGGRKLRAAVGGGIFVLTSAGLWYLERPDAPPRKRFDTMLADVLSLRDGRLVLLTVYATVVELAGRERRVLASMADDQIPLGRPISLAERGGTIWIALDRYLIALRAGRVVEQIGPDDGLESGGPLLVDREGSLWLGTFAGLLQYPEPETTLWNGRNGLPSRHARFVARSGDIVWVTTWQGTGRLRRAGGRVEASTVRELRSQSRPCTDPTGIVWLATRGGVVRLRGDHVVGRLPHEAGFNSCAAASHDGLWMTTDRGLLHADSRRGTLRHITGLPFGRDDVMLETVLQDRAGRLWVTSGERVCHARAAAVLAGRDARWSCESVRGALFITGLLELPDGVLWASSREEGVLARIDGVWQPLPVAATLPGRSVFAMVPSPRGGLWIVGHGILMRVRPHGDQSWDVLEAPGPRNGLPSVGGGDLLEDPDGTLWIATALGVLRVPPRARFIPTTPPPVVVVDARVDTEAVALDHALELSSERNRLELRFAALSFRDPGDVRYQVRLAPEAPWSDTRGHPWFRWVDLPAGSYRAEVRASLDGHSWSARPARFAFRVLPPWYRTPWALALFAVLGSGVLWGAYRARIAFLLGLERQRTRIAMDLHDELGSGLGSMGILAGLLADGRLDDSHRGRIAREVVETAEELGSALSDIVWSLDPRAATLEELVARLAGHAERFFAGNDVEFTLCAPRAWPRARLPLALRRNLLLIGLEALHNAARHARARRVTLALAHRGPFWELSVADDGVGFRGGAPRERHRGRGVAGMRRRAEEIGATLEWREGSGGGTTVVLRFALAGRARGRARALRARLRRRLPMA